MKTNLKKAINAIRKELINDPEYFVSWKSNIAVQFQDVYEQNKDKDIHAISNIAAHQFIELLCESRIPETHGLPAPLTTHPSNR